MAAKKLGISVDLLIHPGETIADYLLERELSQKELASRAGVSEAFLSDVIHGKKDISKGLAIGLEYATGVTASFWLNLQARYDAELLSLNEELTVDDDEKKTFSNIREVVKYLKDTSKIEADKTIEKDILSLRKIFQIRKLTCLKNIAAAGAFRMSENATVDPEILGAWICLCKNLRSKEPLNTVFDQARSKVLISELKQLLSDNLNNPYKQLIDLFANYGIDFNMMRSFKGAPVHGFISTKEDGTYQMVLTLCNEYADSFWFSLFHELGHILNGDFSKTGNYIDNECKCTDTKESQADQFARNTLLDSESYDKFVNRGSFSLSSIKEFAKSQNIPAYIVIGRLQKDKYISSGKFNENKLKYKWGL